MAEDRTFATHFMETALAALAAGFEVAVATCVAEHKEVIERCGVRVVEMPTDRASLSIVSLFRSVLRLSGILSDLRPDLVHALQIRSVILLGLLRLISQRYPLLASFTGLGYLWGLRGWTGKIVRRFIRLQTAWIARDRSTLVSFENTDDRSEFPRLRNCVVLGGWGVEVEPARLSQQRPEGPVRVAFLGRMLRAKGIEDTVKAVRLARERDQRIELELWGSPDPGNPTSHTEEELIHLSCVDGVKWKGRAPHVEAVWQRADIAILLSEREGLPRALIEAAGHGVPMIATDVPGCRSVVRNEIDGLLVPCNDPQATAEAIVRLTQNAVVRKQMGRMARERFETTFSTDAVVPRILEIYASLIACHKYAASSEVFCNDQSRPIFR
ncbi:glycosyltransferase [Bradyrhizobium sp. UFLA05-112]